MYLQPFDKHSAHVAALHQTADELRDLAAEALSLAAATRAAYQPAIDNWHGMGAAEMAAAGEPLQRGAQAESRAQVWAAAVAEYWATQVEGFNRQVDVITAGLASQAADDYGASGTGGAPPAAAQVADARGAATAAAKQQWMQAYDTHIDTGRHRAAAMLARGPTEQGLAELREAGVLGSPGSAGSLSGLGAMLTVTGVLPRAPVGGTPAQHAAWWASLSPQVQRALLATRPGMLGNLNGLPAGVRHQANVSRLRGEMTRLDREIGQLRAKLSSTSRGPGYEVTYHDELQRLDQLTAKRASLTAIEATLGRKGGRQLLALDLSKDRAEAAVAIGNVDTARHVAVFTPGYTSTVDGGLAGYDEQMRQLHQHAQDQARRFGGGSVATVTWIGYQAPQELGEVAGSGHARAGGADLAEFYRGINASRPDDPHLTAIGHSYGSTTTGYAVQQPDTGVDDVIHVGSPGMGTSDVGDTHVPPGHTYVVEARSDPVADLGRFGEDPALVDGTTGLSADEEAVRGEELNETTGHSTRDPENPNNGYLADNTASQYNISTVVAGRPEQAVHDPGIGVGDGVGLGARGPWTYLWRQLS